MSPAVACAVGASAGAYAAAAFFALRGGGQRIAPRTFWFAVAGIGAFALTRVWPANFAIAFLAAALLMAAIGRVVTARGSAPLAQLLALNALVAMLLVAITPYVDQSAQDAMRTALVVALATPAAIALACALGNLYLIRHAAFDRV